MGKTRGKGVVKGSLGEAQHRDNSLLMLSLSNKITQKN